MEVTGDPECTGVTRDNEDHCCRGAYFRDKENYTGAAAGGGCGATCTSDEFFHAIEAIPTITTTTTTSTTNHTTTTTTRTRTARLLEIKSEQESTTAQALGVSAFAVAAIYVGYSFWRSRKSAQDSISKHPPESGAGRRSETAVYTPTRTGAHVGSREPFGYEQLLTGVRERSDSAPPMYSE